MEREQTIAVSLSLQQFAQEVDDFLALRAGERVPFTITLAADCARQRRLWTC